MSKQTLSLGLAIVLLCVLAAELVHVARLYSANWDEAHHLYDGYMILTRHDYRANAEVPPLVKIAAALPILHLHPVVPARVSASQQLNAFQCGRLFVFGNGGDRLLVPARFMCILFSLGTALLVYAVARRMFGVVAGLIALFLFAFDPNVIAHGSLISTDMGSACFLFGTVYAFYRFEEQPVWRWVLATGLLAGLAMVAKFTGVLVAPMLVALAVVEGIRTRSAAVVGRLLGGAVAALLCGWFVIWAFYGFRYAPAAGGLALSPALGPYLASMPNKSDGVKLAMMARFHLLPQAYLWGLANTKYTAWEYTSYFLGRMYRHGPWEYFPLAFLIKSTLPLLLLLVLAPVAWLGSTRRYWRELVFLLVPVCVYFAVIMPSHFDIGARHLMPVYPFLYVVAGATAAILLRRGRGWAVAVAVLLAWQLVTTVRVAPSYMAYGNEAWGGPLQVRRYLSDANVDWGQQLKTVKQYLDDNHIEDCWFAYFPDGAVQPQDYGIHCKRLPTQSGLWWFKLPMEVPPQIEGTVLISESDLDGVESGEGVLNPFDGFHKVQPVAILQDGVYVYRGTFAVPLASAWVAVRRSDELTAAGHVDQAVQVMQDALALAPDYAFGQYQMGQLLRHEHRWPEAAEHYQLAQRLRMAQRPDLQDRLGPEIEAGLQEVAARQ